MREFISNPESGLAPSFCDIDVKKVRALVELQSPVILHGFMDTINRELFIGKGHELSNILPWIFGILQEVKDHKKVKKVGQPNRQ